MLLWVLFALLTLLVLFFVLKPLWPDAIDGDVEQADSDQAADIAVYRDQLKEIDADQERGLIGGQEAVAAKLEVSRRILKLAAPDAKQAAGDTGNGKDSAQSTGSKTVRNVPGLDVLLGLLRWAGARFSKSDMSSRAGRETSRKVALYGSVLAVPVMTLALYSFSGSPNLPSLPFADRMAARPASSDKMGVLIARVEAELRANPNNSDGWNVIAPVYLRQQRYDDAVKAYGRAIKLSGETPARLLGLAMAKLSLQNGAMAPEIRALFKRVLKLSPRQPEARYWLAVAKEQDGKLKEAAADYRSMLASAPADAPWRGVVAGQLGELTVRMGSGTSGAGRVATTQQMSGSSSTQRAGSPPMTRERGPTAVDIAAAGKMSQGDRSQMINTMVAGLAARLQDNGDDLPGWQKLVRAYVVLGKPDKAKQALQDARKSFVSNAKALAALDQMAKQFKLDT